MNKRSLRADTGHGPPSRVPWAGAAPGWLLAVMLSLGLLLTTLIRPLRHD